MDEPEVRLAGGNITAVWRVGDTVRRSTGPWTPNVHALLRHLVRATAPGIRRAARSGATTTSRPTTQSLAAAPALRRLRVDRTGRPGRGNPRPRRAVCDLFTVQAALGDPAFQRHLAEGHLDGYHRDLASVP